MEFISQSEFEKLVDVCPYFKDRWGYYQKVIEWAKAENPNTILEIGVYKMPIAKESDTMDIEPHFATLTYQRDAMQIPYEFIPDKKYDLLVAMQCLEHLHPKQKEVFQEWKRIAKTIIVSLPYLWHCPNDIMHHQIDRRKMNDWTGMVPEKEAVIDSRIIALYKTNAKEQ